jgi:hypothetical protein
MYAVGATDKMQGTGVWSGLKLSREGGKKGGESEGRSRPAQKKKAPTRFTPGKK